MLNNKLSQFKINEEEHEDNGIYIEHDKAV